MHPRLLDYYNEELGHVREMGAEFAREFPKIAARLGMEGMEVADPYVERLLEGFAFVAGRTRLKLDAEFPRFTQHLLDIVYPHLLAPTPAMGVVGFQPRTAEPALAEGVDIAAGSLLRSVIPKGEQTACEFRTAHRVTLWPFTLGRAEFFAHAADLPLGQLGLARQARSGLRLGLDLPDGVAFDAIRCDTLDVHVQGIDSVAGPLLETIAGHCLGALVMTRDQPARVLARLPAGAIGEAGFDDAEALLPLPDRAFQGYRLLREYFALPQRFQFFRLAGLARAWSGHRGSGVDLVLLFDVPRPALERVVDARNFALYATPVVNLFARRADRVPVSDAHAEHHLIVDRARPLDFEVHSITAVRGLGPSSPNGIELRPFYGDHVHHDPASDSAYYTLRREPRLPSERQRRRGGRTSYVGHEVFLALVDGRAAPYPSDLNQLAVEVLATNRDLPLLLPVGGLNPLSLRDARPVSAITVLAGPTRPRPTLAEGEFAWRLISHLALNHLSLVEPGGDGRRAATTLRELLTLHADPGDAAHARRIESLERVAAQPVVRRLPVAGPITFGRGLAVTLTLNEAGFDGAGGWLFGAVLEKFLARHVSINTFTETTLRSDERGEIGRWPARAGTRIVG